MRNILLICLFLLLAWENSLAAPVAWNVKPSKSFFKGNGSLSDPYIISSVEDFALMAAYSTDSTKRGRSYILETDIVINEGNAANWGTKPPKYKWISLGDSSREASVYLDGNGHTISGLYVNSEKDYQGLFGKVRGQIKNLKVVNSFIKGGNYVGAVAGKVRGSDGGVDNVFVEAIVEGQDYVGGVAGQSFYDDDGGAVSNAVFKGSVKGHSYVGGIFGAGSADYSSSAYSSHCDNYGSVVGSGKYIGGIFGHFEIDVAEAGLNKLRNFGAVSGAEHVGGIGGELYINREIKFGHDYEFSYLRNMGEVFGDSYVGGLFGEYSRGKTSSPNVIEYSYNAGRVKGNDHVDPLFTLYGEDVVAKWHSYSFAETYKGDLVLLDERKTLEELNDYTDSLGAYYIPDTGATKLNDGFPILIEENKNFTYLKGSGTSDDPYLISNMDDLIMFGKHARAVDRGYYKQTADIMYDTLRNWMPAVVKGLIYDGDNHKIINFKSVWPNGYAGFIDTSYSSSITVKNLELSNVHVDGYYLAGALAARLYNANLSNIKVSGKVVARGKSGSFSGSGYAGGVVGRLHWGGTIDNVENYANVTGPEYAGGILGEGSLSVYHSANYGNIYAVRYAGGISGVGGTMVFVKNYGNVRANEAGGIAARASKVIGSFNRGQVRGVEVGGIASEARILSYVYSTGNVITDSLEVGGMILGYGSSSSTSIVNHAYYEKKGNFGLSGSKNIFSIDFADTASFTQQQFLEKDVVQKMGVYFAYDENGENDGYPILYEGFKGKGTTDSPYLISSKEDLYRLSSLVKDSTLGNLYQTKKYKLTKDIVFESSDIWEPIGSVSASFDGEFDGDNHIISGLNVDVTGTKNHMASLFSHVTGSIMNLGVVNSKFVGDTAAAIASVLYGSSVKNCWNRNSEVKGDSVAGGIVALATIGSTFDRVFNTGTVNGSHFVGGIVGYVRGSRFTLSNSFNVGKVQVTDNSNGSLSTLIGISSLKDNMKIQKVYTTSTVKAESGNYSESGEFGVNIFYLQGDSQDSNGLTQEFMKSKEFVELLGSEFEYDSAKVNNGYPILINSKALFKKAPGANDEPKIAKNIPLYNVAASHGAIAISGLAGNEKVTVVKVNGKVAWDRRATGTELTVHVNSPGIYFVKVKSMVAKVLVH